MQTPISEQPVFWHQGLFLQPQHLQQQELYLRNLLQPLQHYLTSDFWGIAGLTVDLAGLQNGRLGLVDGAFLWPDGTWVTLPGNSSLSSRQLPAELPEGKSKLLVYIGLRRLNPHQANCHFTDDEASIQQNPRRFRCSTQPGDIFDFYQGQGSGQVHKMQYALRLFLETETAVMDDFDLLPVLRLNRAQDQWQLDHGYSPPLLNIRCSSTMTRLCQEIRDTLTARCRQLTEYKNPRALSQARPEQQAGILNYLLALRTLNRYLPLWISLEQSGCHPSTAYHHLRQLIGELSTFSPRIDAMGQTPSGQNLVSDYDHAAISDCFLQLQKLLNELLDEIVVGPEHILPMHKDPNGFAVEIPAVAFDRRNRYYILVKGIGDKATKANVATNLLALTKMAAEEEMDELCQRALPGLKAQIIETSPAGLPRRDDTLYLELDSHDSHWNAVQRYRNLRLQWDQSPEYQCELVVIQD